MKKIKFRGKTDDGDLVKGILIQGSSKKFQIWYGDEKYSYIRDVDPESLAQFVGYDKNGEEIYSDDTIIEDNLPGAVPQKYIAGNKIPVNRIGEKFLNYELVKEEKNENYVRPND